MMNYIPYSEYPFWVLKEWRERAAQAGDNAFVAVMQLAIEAKENMTREGVEE